MALHLLPNEVLMEIFKFTPAPTQKSLMLVNKNFYNLLGKTESFYRDRSLRFHDGNISHIKHLSRFNRIVQHIRFDSCDYQNMKLNSDFMAALSTFLQRYGKYIKSLITRCPMFLDNLFRVLDKTPNIESIQTTMVCQGNFQESWEFTHKFLKLKKLDMDVCESFYRKVVIDAEQLVHLVLRGEFSLLKNKPNLKSLIIDVKKSKTQLDPADIKFSLDTLQIRSNVDEVFKPLSELVSTQQTLKNLQVLTDFPKCFDLIREMDKLEKLVLFLDYISSIETRPIIPNYKMKKLALGIRRLERTKLSLIVQHFPRLTDLHIVSTYIVDENNLEALNQLRSLEEFLVCESSELSAGILNRFQFNNLKRFHCTVQIGEDNLEQFLSNHIGIKTLHLKILGQTAFRVFKQIAKHLLALEDLVMLVDTDFLLKNPWFGVFSTLLHSLKRFRIIYVKLDDDHVVVSDIYLRSVDKFLNKTVPNLNYEIIGVREHNYRFEELSPLSHFHIPTSLIF